MNTTPDVERIQKDIYDAFRRVHGSLSLVSGYRGRNDPTKLSRQLNPWDERRDNPFTESLAILEAAARFAPDLEAELWAILEAERSRWARTACGGGESIGRLIHRVGDELNDVTEAVIDGADARKLRKEVAELKAIVLKLEAKLL